METGENSNDNNRERTLEGSISNVPMKRFKVMSTEDQFKWLLPEEMAEYVNDHFQTFLPEKGVHDSILMENPIQSNVDQQQTVDDFIVPLMSKNETAVDLSLEKVQQKIVNVMGPLATIWKALEDVKNDPTLTLSLEEVATNMDKTVLLLGQAFQAATCHHRFNALSSVMKDHRKLKETLKEKADLLSGEHRMLFGDKFQHYITETVKTRQKSEELFKSMSKGKSQPFRQGPPPQKSSSGGRRISFSRRPGPDSRVAPNSSFPRQGSSGRKFSEKGTFLQHASRIDPTGEGTFCSRRVIFIRGTGKSEVGRQIKTFFQELEETDWGQKNFGNCAGLQNPISHGSNPGQGSSQSKNEYRSIHFSESRNRKHVAERCHSESATCFRRVFK